MAKKQREPMGFRQAMEYVLDVLCFAYYVKSNPIVSDQVFDELEKMYMTLTGAVSSPSRGLERRECYTTGVQVVYSVISDLKEKKSKELTENG